MKKLYRKVTGKKIPISHACEVGVYLPETSNIGDFLKAGIRGTLVEADPSLWATIRDYFKSCNMTLHPYAIWSHHGRIKLAMASASTFVADLTHSPAIENDNYSKSEKKEFEVECRLFSEIDDGMIDLLSVDIEGGEWYVIEQMVSRPKVISLETHGKGYVNPFLPEILRWMNEHGFEIWYKDSSDTIFFQKHLFELSWAEQSSLLFQSMSLLFAQGKAWARKFLRRALFSCSPSIKKNP